MTDRPTGRSEVVEVLRAAATRAALLPPAVPEDDPRREDWAEAVYQRGETPFGRCSFCGVARSPAGCLNLCEMPAGFVRSFNDGLAAVIAKRRADWALLETLGGCTCPPPRLSGYQDRRESHHYGCPMENDPSEN